MSLYKVVEKVDFRSKSWVNYCKWRNYNFSSFDSLDGTIRESCFVVKSDEDWKYSFLNGQYLTDFITDQGYAEKIHDDNSNSEILCLDLISNKNNKAPILGYDILDGPCCYSLLCNFGNDIKRINDVLCKNAMIKNEYQVIEIFRWLHENMAEDGHVIDSNIYVVYDYGKIV